MPVLRDLKKLAAEVVREESEKTPMARKVHASFTKFQDAGGPWDHVAEDRALLLSARGCHEPDTMQEFGFNKKAYEVAPGRSAENARPCRAAVHVYSLTDYHVKNAIALERLRTEFNSKVDIVQFPVSVLRDLKKLAAEVVREESEKTPLARKVHASYTKFQALVSPWDRVAEGAYHQFVAM